MARPAAVAEQVDVELQLLAPRREREHVVVELLERRARAEEPEPRAHPADVRVDGDVRHPEREQEHARGGLAADTGQGGEVGHSIPTPQPAQVGERNVTVGVGERVQHLLDALRLHGREAAAANGSHDLVEGRVASFLFVVGMVGLL